VIQANKKIKKQKRGWKMDYKICKIWQERGRKREWNEIKNKIGTEMDTVSRTCQLGRKFKTATRWQRHRAMNLFGNPARFPFTL
jgi:hypothetical protein